MIRCPYRKAHEYDAEGLCVHCYAARPPTDKEVTAPMAIPDGMSIWSWAKMYAPPASPELQKAMDDLEADLDALPGIKP